MVIDKIRKMTVKGVKLKSESFFLISPGVLELWSYGGKTLGEGSGFRPPPSMDRVNKYSTAHFSVHNASFGK